MEEPESESGAHARVRALVTANVPSVVLAVKVLRIPGVLVGLPAIPALVTVTILAATAQSWWRVGLLLLSLAGWVLVALWWIRLKRYHDAIADPDRLAGELVRAFEMFDAGGELFDRMLAVFEGGGLRLLYRLRSLWRVVTIPDYLAGTVEELGAARWFLPPMPATTALRLTLLLWTTAGAWLVMIVLIVLRTAGVA